MSAPIEARPDSATLLQEALDPVQPLLGRVDARLQQELDDPLARRVLYLITAGGKRLRPAMVLLTGLSGPAPREDDLITGAAVVELIHTATLIHDDIIDLSTLRRQQPTFHARWGTERAVLTGDLLYATAFAMLSRLADPAPTRVLAQVCQELSRGELREVEARQRLDLSEDEYFAIIRDKTASLTGACCRIGARLGGFSDEAVEAWGAFGISFGLAFQIVDDCLDLTGDPRELGKSILSDLDKGALSLPMIYLAGGLAADERRRLFGPVLEAAASPSSADASGRVDRETLARIAGLARESGAVARAQERAAALIAEAERAVAGVSAGPLSRACRALAAYAVARRS